jgi:ferrochelatase
MSRSAILLLNLGSPASTNVPDVRRYLREFLSDSRVLDIPAPLRWLVLNLFILPSRPHRSAEAYRRIWTPEGSPLLAISARQQALLQEGLDVPVLLGMRYGSPGVKEVVDRLQQLEIQKLFIIPLYPHYAMSSYETGLVAVTDELHRRNLQIRYTIQQPFYNADGYIDALMKVARPYLEQPYDHLLFSFHGLPERHLRKTDPSHAHCLRCEDCCSIAHPAHATCYRSQAFATVRAFASAADLDPARYGVSFQSRLGSEPWLRPFTDEVLKQLANEGKKRLLVICPAFVTDCLETLEEIAITGREQFIKAGGAELTLIPCLNDSPAWIDLLTRWCREWLERHERALTMNPNL